MEVPWWGSRIWGMSCLQIKIGFGQLIVVIQCGYKVYQIQFCCRVHFGPSQNLILGIRAFGHWRIGHWVLELWLTVCKCKISWCENAKMALSANDSKYLVFFFFSCEPISSWAGFLSAKAVHRHLGRSLSYGHCKWVQVIYGRTNLERRVQFLKKM